MKKFIKKNLFSFIITSVLLCAIGVYAVVKIYATDVSINSTNINELTNADTLDTAITKLYEKSNTCPSGYSCLEKHNTLQIGDYVKMTPTSTSYTTDKSKTGYSSTQTINPSELNTWRVIRINGDGTIDLVSEYVSSVSIYFKGQTGYKNLVGYLNVLASQYANSKYIVRTRHMGYNEQTEYLTDTANTVDSTSTTAPWTSSTSDNNDNESQGRGDRLHRTDIGLVNNIGILMANKVGTTTSTSYWLASRSYVYRSSTNWDYDAHFIGDYGAADYVKYLYRYNNSYSTYSPALPLRPIVTLKSNISYSPAGGTSDDPFVLN